MEQFFQQLGGRGNGESSCADHEKSGYALVAPRIRVDLDLWFLAD
jgi:hypothetical protein